MLYFCKYSQVPIIRRPIIRQARFYGTFFKYRSIRHILDSRSLFVQKYPTVWNVPDEFRHIRLNCPRVAAAILKAQRFPPSGGSQPKHSPKQKHPCFVYTRSLSRVGASFVLLLPLAFLFFARLMSSLWHQHHLAARRKGRGTSSLFQRRLS